MNRENVYIDSSAHVSDEAEIGAGTRVWINSQIREDVKIGEGCNIGKDTYIDFSVQIGNGVKIQNGVSVYHGVTVEDDVFIGPSAAFTNDLYPRASVSDFDVKNTLVKKGASIGANATIVCGVTLGEYCLVGSGSVVTRDVPAYTIVTGNPARASGRICRCGEKLGRGETVCKKCGYEIPENRR